MFTEGPADLTTLDGRQVRIRGRATGTNSVIASELEDRDPAEADADVTLQGVVRSFVSGSSVTILGVTAVSTSGITKFEDVSDHQISPTAFFNALAANPTVLVKAKGELNAGTVIWEEIELED